MNDSLNCPDKELIVTWVYDEANDHERATLEAHLARCTACAREVESLTAVRRQLAGWQAPALATAFQVQVVPRAAATPATLPPRQAWGRRLAYAAAASLVLGASAGIANLDVRVGSEGLVVRTGWGSDAAAPAVAAPAPAVAEAPMPSPPVAAASALERPAEPAAPTTEADARWRQALADVEARLERRLAEVAVPAPAAPQVRAASSEIDARLLARLQALVDESEVRQQQNLALRVSELARDFDLQRRADLVQIEQGIGRLGIDAVQHQQMWDYFRRVSSQRAPRQ
jgi:hypothetical protein